ncbi:hypothetical protein pb186bvf_008023 [Paramecium bursaria]
MIFYQDENELEQHFLCKICLKICYIPMQCSKCRCLYCYKCFDKLEYMCQDCVFSLSNLQFQMLNFKLDLHYNILLNNIKCRCRYCYKYKFYRKFRDHQGVCKQLNDPEKFQQNYIIYKEDLEITFPIACQTCQIQIIYPYQCLQCKNYICPRCKKLKIQMCCQKQQLISGEELEKQFNIKFSCAICLIYLKHEDLKKHMKDFHQRKSMKARQIKLLKEKIESFDIIKNSQQSSKISNCLEMFECQTISEQYLQRFNIMFEEKLLKQKYEVKQECNIYQNDIKQEDVKQEFNMKQEELKQEEIQQEKIKQEEIKQEDK